MKDSVRCEGLGIKSLRARDINNLLIVLMRYEKVTIGCTAYSIDGEAAFTSDGE